MLPLVYEENGYDHVEEVNNRVNTTYKKMFTWDKLNEIEDKPWSIQEEEDLDEESDINGGLHIEEKFFGEYHCPKFILSKKEERHIVKP